MPGRSAPLNLDEVRTRARRHIPRAVFDFIDGGVGDELTLARNRAAFGNVVLRPRVLRNVGKRDLSVTVVGETLPFPVLPAPVGVPFVASTAGSYSIRRIAAVVERKPWFQLFPCVDPDVTKALLANARAAGVRVLVVTVDAAGGGRRERDLFHRIAVPLHVTRLRLRTFADGARHPDRKSVV